MPLPLNQETLLFEPAQPVAGALRAVLAFPSTYSVGITSLGYQVVWATLARRADVDVRRLFTDRSDPPHRHGDLFGLSLSWELDGPVLLDLLEQQRIPLWAEQRGESDPIVFGGGPVLTANPEPLAPFFDVVLLGDGEELLPAFIDAVQQHRDRPRAERLRALAQVPGIYVPSLYAPRYAAGGELLAVEPIEAGVPSTVAKQTWRGNTLSHSTVITPEAAWPDIHMVEVVRSCPELCRFCLASYLTLPFRTPSLDDGLIPAVEKGLAVTKRLGLLGASVTQHPQFPELLQWLDQDRFEGTRVSVSSVRAATVTAELGRILAKRGSKSLTIAIESGSERMRQVVNKKLATEEIDAAARYAREGWPQRPEALRHGGPAQRGGGRCGGHRRPDAGAEKGDPGAAADPGGEHLRAQGPHPVPVAGRAAGGRETAQAAGQAAQAQGDRAAAGKLWLERDPGPAVAQRPAARAGDRRRPRQPRQPGGLEEGLPGGAGRRTGAGCRFAAATATGLGGGGARRMGTGPGAALGASARSPA